jgi:hypothetical protein
MRVLAVEGTPGQRFVDVLEPMSADEIGVVGDGAKVTGVRGVAFALSTRTDEAFPKQAAIGRAEMKLADLRSLRILATNETRIVDESGRLGEYQGDGFATYPVPSNCAHGAGARA